MTLRFESADNIRAAFSAAMSAMYREEVPAYGTLLDLVAEANNRTLRARSEVGELQDGEVSLERVAEERHGAIRVGTADELSMMRRVFAVMGMYPVGYYDLSAAGVPVHSTAFRPLGASALHRAPFRIFTSLLRLDLIDDEVLRHDARDVLANRTIVNAETIRLTEKAERQGGLGHLDANTFITGATEIFRWHDRANVSVDLYQRLHDAHRLVADVVSFRGPHINHLTPRTLDIDLAQSLMLERGISPKAVIEGPPARKCPILLRQTSFKALQERVSFRDAAGVWQAGSHTARFGEIEQRGIALTPKGRALYDKLLAEAHGQVRPAADGSNVEQYRTALNQAFRAFPDSWDAIRSQELGYFTYRMTGMGRRGVASQGRQLEELIAEGLVAYDPLIYEDFLPVSAAGIFQSNLGDNMHQGFASSPNQQRFEADLGAAVLNEFDYYAGIQSATIGECRRALNCSRVAE